MTYNKEKNIQRYGCLWFRYVPDHHTRKDRHIRTWFQSHMSTKFLKKHANKWLRRHEFDYHIFPYKKGKVDIGWYF